MPVLDPVVTPIFPYVAPAGMKIDEPDSVALSGFMLVSITVTPPGGAGTAKPTSNKLD